MSDQQFQPVGATLEQGGQDHEACAPAATNTVLRFRRFSMIPGARVLLADGSPVPLGSRAFDLLLVLVQARGTLVTKEAIIRRVWPSTIVEESNLRFQMACVRKALGRDRDLIKTIPGRGYLLAADIDGGSAKAPASDGARGTKQTGSMGGPPWAGVPSSERPNAGARPTLVLFDEDESTRERVQTLLRLAGLQVQLFGSVNAFLSDARAAA